MDGQQTDRHADTQKDRECNERLTGMESDNFGTSLYNGYMYRHSYYCDNSVCYKVIVITMWQSHACLLMCILWISSILNLFLAVYMYLVKAIMADM